MSDAWEHPNFQNYSNGDLAVARCVVLNATVNCSASHDSLLRSIVRESPDLIAISGAASCTWEEQIDCMCVELDISGEQPGAFCNTTSHPNETLDEVIAFAAQWCDLKGWPRDVRVVNI
jgi:hypothetical protein